MGSFAVYRPHLVKNEIVAVTAVRAVITVLEAELGFRRDFVHRLAKLSYVRAEAVSDKFYPPLAIGKLAVEDFFNQPLSIKVRAVKRIEFFYTVGAKAAVYNG